MNSIITGERPNYTQAPPRPPHAGGPGEPPPRWYERRGVQVLLGIAAAVAVMFLWLTWSLPVGRALEPLKEPTLVLITADGKAFSRRGAYKEAPVEVDQLPAHVPGAFIAIEDRRFYHHLGVDPIGIGRALMTNTKGGGVRQGGSTITQQLAKNAFLSNKRTLRRKAQEAIIALYLEARLSKKAILSRYLSSVYFGDGVFGLRAAARHYFNKNPEQLSVGEAAMLAGLVKAPTKLAPTENFPAAKKRAQTVLSAMVAAHMIDRSQAAHALDGVKVRPGRANLPVGSYFADWISPQVRTVFNRAYGEVQVWTTLDSQMQLRAQQAVAHGLANGRNLHVTQAALVAMRTDGRVVAMVGGSDYRKSQYNRVTQAERQPGSTFKMFVYLAALRRGMSPESLVVDAPVTIGGWSPQNHEGHYAGGPVPLRDAFARSSNVAAARLVAQIGVGPVIDTARDLGVTRPLPNDATIALGTGSMTLMELTSAYAALANGAAPVTPRGLLQQDVPPPTRRIGERERQGMLVMLRDVVQRGTGVAANIGPDVFGKTGTSQDYRDAYFVGFAGDLVVGVWVGNDDNSPMRRVTGGMIPAQIWREFMSYAMTRKDFPKAGPQITDEQLFDFGGQEMNPDDFVLPEGVGANDNGFDPGGPQPAPLDAPPIPGAAPPPPQVNPRDLEAPPPEQDSDAPEEPGDAAAAA